MTKKIFLPSLLHAIRQEFGLDIAKKFAEVYGGKTMYISKKSNKNDIVDLFGLEMLDFVRQNVGWGIVVIPMGQFSGKFNQQKSKVIKIAANKNLSVKEAATLACCHERTIRRWRSRIKNNPSWILTSDM